MILPNLEEVVDALVKASQFWEAIVGNDTRPVVGDEHIGAGQMSMGTYGTIVQVAHTVCNVQCHAYGKLGNEKTFLHCEKLCQASLGVTHPQDKAVVRVYTGSEERVDIIMAQASHTSNL